MLCFAELYVHSSFAIISLGKRERVALLLLCSECHVAIIVHSLGAMGWSIVCDCGISWSYSLIFFYFFFERGNNILAVLLVYISVILRGNLW